MRQLILGVVIIVFLIGAVIANVSGSTQTGSNFVVKSLTFIATPITWTINKFTHRIEKVEARMHENDPN